MKPTEVGRCTKEEIAEVLEGFEEEMLASIRRNREPKAEIVEFPPKLEEQELGRRERVLNQDRNRLEERIDEQRREAGLPSLKAARQMREGLAFAPAPGKVLGNHDPIKLFQDEIEKEEG